jgi:hypothetical protein
VTVDDVLDHLLPRDWRDQLTEPDRNNGTDDRHRDPDPDPDRTEAEAADA